MRVGALGGQQREDGGNGRGAAEPPEDATDLGEPDAREERFEVHVHDDRPAAVGRGVTDDPPAGDEASAAGSTGNLATISWRIRAAGLHQATGAGAESVRCPPLFFGTVNWT